MSKHRWTVGEAALTLGTALLAAATATAGLASSVPDRVARWRPLAHQAAVRFGISEDWILRVIRAESAGLTVVDGRAIRSRAGAIGLMQLMPATWAAMRQAHGLGADPDDPEDNILAGSAFLRAMYDRFGYPGLFAAYNVGPTRYAAALASGQRLPQETVAYLAKLSGTARLSTPPSRPESLFALRHDRGEAAISQRIAGEKGGLFAVESGAR